jgi:hypothetical protein
MYYISAYNKSLEGESILKYTGAVITSRNAVMTEGDKFSGMFNVIDFRKFIIPSPVCRL